MVAAAGALLPRGTETAEVSGGFELAAAVVGGVPDAAAAASATANALAAVGVSGSFFTVAMIVATAGGGLKAMRFESANFDFSCSGDIWSTSCTVSYKSAAGTVAGTVGLLTE